jgi:predicted ribosomally synthesized peptide with nif11-like leader
MSAEQAQAFLKRIAEDEAFRQRLGAAPAPSDKRAILTAEGYGDVRLRHFSEALPQSLGGELSDDELVEVAGGLDSSTAVSVVGSTTMSVVAVAGAALAA